MIREWMSSDTIGIVYRKPNKKWVLCVEHTGDNHYKYRYVTCYGDDTDLLYLELGKTFFEYGGGWKKCHWQPTKREFYLLMAGEKISIRSGVQL